MPFWLAELADSFGSRRIDATKAMLVETDSSSTVRPIASAREDGDNDWTSATITEITSGVASDYEGWTYRVKIGGDNGQDVVSVDYVGVAADTINDIGTGLATALNARPEIANASFSFVPNELTAADVADGLGDRTLVLEVFPPGAENPLPEMVGTIVDNGIAAAALTVVLEEPTAIPAVLRQL
jgi:hypothetical protein